MACREVTVKVRDPDEGDECMMCRRPAVSGTKWARYCRWHRDQADPIEVVEDMSYVTYRRARRGEG